MQTVGQSKEDSDHYLLKDNLGALTQQTGLFVWWGSGCGQQPLMWGTEVWIHSLIPIAGISQVEDTGMDDT